MNNDKMGCGWFLCLAGGCATLVIAVMLTLRLIEMFPNVSTANLIFTTLVMVGPVVIIGMLVSSQFAKL